MEGAAAEELSTSDVYARAKALAKRLVEVEIRKESFAFEEIPHKPAVRS